MREYEKQFVEIMRMEGKADTTIKQYSRYAKIFNNYIESVGKSLHNINKLDIMNFRDQCNGSNSTKNTIVRAISTYIRCINTYVDSNVTTDTKGIKGLKNIKKAKERREIVSSDTMIEVLNYFYEEKKDYKTSAMLAILFSTAARKSEVQSLRFEDIKHFENKFTTETEIIFTQKGGDEKVGYVTNEKFISILNKYLSTISIHSKDDFVFSGVRGRMSKTNHGYLNDKLKECYSTLDLPVIKPHDIRKRVASDLLNAGYTVEQVSKITGHKDTSVLYQIYYTVTKEEQKNMMKNIKFGG